MYLSRLMLNPRSRDVRRDIGDCHQLHGTIMRAFPHLDRALTMPEAAPTPEPVALGTTIPLDLDAAPRLLASTSSDARARLGVLHRLDVSLRTGQVALLVQSAARPDWTHLPPGYLTQAPDAENPAVKHVAEAYAAIHDGNVLHFRLRANPTKRLPPTTSPDGVRRDGKRVDLRREEEQLQWLARKAADHGFRLLSATVRPGLPDSRPASGADPVPVRDVHAIPRGRAVGRRSARPGAFAGLTMTFADVLFEGRLEVIDADVFRHAITTGIGSGKAYGFGLLSVARPVS